VVKPGGIKETQATSFSFYFSLTQYCAFMMSVIACSLVLAVIALAIVVVASPLPAVFVFCFHA
jgi:uncharacterized membrane protein